MTSTQRDREAAILLAAYPDRMRLPDPEDVYALLDFLSDGENVCTN